MNWKPVLLWAFSVVALLLLLRPGLHHEDPPDRPEPSAAAAVPEEAPGVPAPSEQPGEECVILVRDEEGRPARAVVYATGLADRPPDRSDYIGETGADGRLAESDFVMRPRGSVFALAPRRVAPPVPFDAGGVELVLGDGVVVTGKAVDKEGRPLSGVLVLGGRGGLNPSRASSGKDGRFRLTGFPPGSLAVCGSTEGFSTNVTVEPAAWDERVEVVLDGFPAPGDSVLLDVRYSASPESSPQLLLRDGKRVSTRWLPRADALVRVDREKGREVEVVCPGFRSAKARLPESGAALRLDLVAGPGMPRALLVVDPAGRPVPAALVLLTRDGADHYPKRGFTGPDGRFALGAVHRGWFAVASAEAGASDRVRIEEGAQQIVLALRPAAVLTGRVLDRETGEPVPGAVVALQGGDCGCCVFWSATTDERGEYRFAGIPAGMFVQPWVGGGPDLDGTRTDQPRSHAEALARGLGHLVEGAETIRFADIPVTRHPTVTCQFTIEPASPGEPVTVTALPDGGTRYLRLDDDGTVSFETRKGPRLFRVESGGLVGVVEGTEGRVRLEPSARVTAALVGPDGAPAAPHRTQWVEATVWLKVDGERRQVDWGGDNAGYVDGRADLTGDLWAVGPPEIENMVALPKGPFQLRDGPFRITPAELAARLRAAGGELVLELPVVPRDRNPWIPIVVVDREGRPVPGVRIGDPDEPENAVVSDDAGRATVRRWSRPLLPWTGKWRLPNAPGDEPVRVVVEPGRRVRLQLLGPKREPLAGEWVEDATGTFYEETDAEGRLDLVVPVRIDPLVLGSGKWWFGAADPSSGEVTARRRRSLDVTVRGPKELAVERSIRVRWEADTPPHTESIGAEWLDQKGDRWRGRLALPPFPARLRAFSSNLRYEARAEALPGTSKLTLTLARLPDHEVTLVLTGPDGRPLADRAVRCGDAAYTTGALVPKGARTDEAGRLVLLLPEGEHVLVDVEVGDLRADEVRFASPAPATVEVRLRGP